ncbi:MAG: LicD family protein [Clostridia bacterium]|nr:LicD family protein [Clostridia bacterium]
MQIELELPVGFLEPEFRDGFYVDEKRKKIWAVELDLLKKFSDVCEKNNLSYYLDGGTLLGAIRHQGFIPWDDDVDVIMPRKDYDKLWEIAEKEFSYPYFFQTSMSEEGFFRTHAQLRNSSTTGVVLIDAEKPQINKGIWLDVFVLDGVADGWIARKLQRRKIQRVKTRLKYAYDTKEEELSGIQKIKYQKAQKYFKNHSFKELFNYFNHKVLGAYSSKKTKWVGDITLKWRPNCQWPSVYYDGYFYLDFECLKLRAPLFACEVMTRQYGNFMKMPADVSNIRNTHGNAIFDPDTPYREFDIDAYFEMLREEQSLIEEEQV